MVKTLNEQINKKRGFSLAEILISMLIMSVAFMALTKVITQKPKKLMEKTPHGFYECYKTNGVLHEDRTRNNILQPENPDVTNCTFDPPKGVYYVNVHYIGMVPSEGAGAVNKYYNAPEAMFDSQVTFSDPSDILSDIPEEFLTESGSYNYTRNFEQDSNMFKAYLELSHQQSQIYQNWKNTGNAPENALFIAW